MRYPANLSPLSTGRQLTSAFGGYDATLTCPENCFSQMQNLTSDHYPLMSPRSPRGAYTAAEAPGAMVDKDALCYVDGSQFMVNGRALEGVTLSTECDSCEKRAHCSLYAAGKTGCPKQLVSMGAYVIVLPDKVRIDTESGTCSQLEAYFSGSNVTFHPCTLSGADLSCHVGASQPEDKKQVWIDTNAQPYALKQYSTATESWVAVATGYVKISCPGIGVDFALYDSVLLSGIEAEELKELNGWHPIWAKEDDYIVVTGLCPGEFFQENPVQAQRTMPDMDFVIESKNRLWGCRYGEADGQLVNEIYGSKLGDPTNWHSFLGISTDSQVISCGTDGPWTGAFALDVPLFFKEDWLYRVYGDSYPFGVQLTSCHGVERGSEKSLAAVGQTLLYKARTGIMAYDGSLPVEVSRCLGGKRYSKAVAGSLGNKYYVSMQDEAGESHLFVYDLARGLWHREDDLAVEEFCRSDGQLYARTGGKLMVMHGQDETVEWMAVTGDMGMDDPDRKYLLRLTLGLRLTVGSRVRVYLSYDGSDTWEPVTELTGREDNGVSLPIRPRRCRRLRLKLAGRGDVKLFGITKTFAKGSELD